MFGLKIFLTILIFLFYTACSSVKTENAPQNIKTNNSENQTVSENIPKNLLITLNRGACYGTCPAYNLTVSADGSVEFEGFDHTKIKGKAKDTISEDKVKALVAEINKSDFFALSDSLDEKSNNCASISTDNPTAKISVRLKDKERTISHYIACPQNSDAKKLEALENKIDEIVETKRWIGEK